MDINDNSPVFTNAQPIIFSVRENAANEFVGNVQATDDDVGINQQISYSVPANNG